eukprot:4370546-Amphidinium_carterae.1
MATFGDLVNVGGPDSDPPVVRDATYVLERPAARTWRLAHGTAWLMMHRPSLDYIAYLDDDSFLHLPRLSAQIGLLGGPKMAMGFLMETALDWTGMHMCDICRPCDECIGHVDDLREVCSNNPELSL